MKAVVIALFALVAVAHAGIVGIGGLSTVQVNAAPLAYAAPIAHIAPIAAAPVVAKAAAPYVAANRGAVHVAPLDGHIVGSQQLNLSPAPGTIW